MDLTFRSISPGDKGAIAAIYTVTEPIPAYQHDVYEITFAMRGVGQCDLLCFPGSYANQRDIDRCVTRVYHSVYGTGYTS